MIRKPKCKARSAIAALCLAAFLAAILSACSERALSSEEICARCLPAVLELKVCDGEGNTIGKATGTVVGADGAVVTNRHVVALVRGGKSVVVTVSGRRYDEEEYFDLEIEAVSSKSDLALLKMPKEKVLSHLEIGDSSALRFGEEVHTIGNGNGFGLAYSHGYIAAPLRTVTYGTETIDAIQTSISIAEGNSGGPILNRKGEVVGIVAFRLRDNGGAVIVGSAYAVPSVAVSDFLTGAL